jgi:hypothetical protein
MTALAIDQQSRPLELRNQTPAEGGLDVAVLAADQLVRQTSGNWRAYVNSAVAEIHAECSAADWDGPGSVPINDLVLQRALNVSDLLRYYVPYATPAPQLIACADGEVTLTWEIDPDQVFSISVGNHGLLNYAGRLGQNGQPHDAVPYGTEAIEQLATYISTLY